MVVIKVENKEWFVMQEMLIEFKHIIQKHEGREDLSKKDLIKDLDKLFGDYVEKYNISIDE